MKNSGNLKDVKLNLEKLIQIYEYAETAHESVIVLLPLEEQTTQRDWFAHITKCNDDFMEDVRYWTSKNEKISLQTDVIVELPTVADTPSLPKKAPVESQEEIPQHDDPLPKINPEVTSDMQELIQPSHRVFNIASSRRSKHSSISGSKAPSSASARIKAEAELAALVV